MIAWDSLYRCVTILPLYLFCILPWGLYLMDFSWISWNPQSHIFGIKTHVSWLWRFIIIYIYILVKFDFVKIEFHFIKNIKWHCINFELNWNCMHANHQIKIWFIIKIYNFNHLLYFQTFEHLISIIKIFVVCTDLKSLLIDFDGVTSRTSCYK
jgi:hypothetical protein